MHLLPAHHEIIMQKTLQEAMTQAGIIHESVPEILIKKLSIFPVSSLHIFP